MSMRVVECSLSLLLRSYCVFTRAMCCIIVIHLLLMKLYILVLFIVYTHTRPAGSNLPIMNSTTIVSV
jgi:hypothetical protein